MMADDVENDDQWLYGDNQDGIQEEEPKTAENEAEDTNEKEAEPEEKEETEFQEENVEEPPDGDGDASPTQQEENDNDKEEGEADADEKKNGEGSDKEDSDDDSDDDVNVVIGDIKTNPTYTSLNIKRGGLLTSSSNTDKSKQQPQQAGKFTVEEFDQAGTINGVPAAEYNLDSLEDKPWRKPGADITDYFNYGFNEDTWRAYCERQKRLRVNESGVGLAPMNAIGLPRGPVPIMNDNSKYSGNFAGVRKAGPPPGRRMTGSIDVIGGTSQRVGAAIGKLDAPKENVIQVMTADRREYSRKPPGFPDMSVPPPSSFDEFQPDYSFNPEPEPFYGGYEPTQDVQWDNDPGWAPQDIKPLTPGPGHPPPILGPPMGIIPAQPVKERSPSHHRESRDREREVSRSRSEKPRERERSHRRERSRSRSRRHKSRSRSPSHRSHRKKKSRRHEDSD